MTVASLEPSARPLKLGSLETGRFIAASFVVLAHFLLQLRAFGAPGTRLFGNVQVPGAIGVQYFFVLSGFVMVTAHRADFGHWASPLKFWLRRVTRIYPVYWLSLAVMIGYFYGALKPGLAFKLVFLPPVPMADWVPPAWSLHYEFAFYLIFGLALLPYIGRPLLALWIVSVCLLWSPAPIADLLPPALRRFLAHLPLTSAQEFFAPFEFYFFSGLLGGFMFSACRLGRAASVFLLASGFVLLATAAPRMAWGFAYGAPLVSLQAGIGFACVMLGLAELERLGALRFGALAARLGAMSYPLYILHGPLLFTLEHFADNRLRFGAIGLYLFTLAVLIAVYGLCAGVTFKLDQPLQRLIARRIRPARAALAGRPRAQSKPYARGWRGGRARNQSLIPARHLSDRVN